jgi:hypothetical protein
MRHENFLLILYNLERDMRHIRRWSSRHAEAINVIISTILMEISLEKCTFVINQRRNSIINQFILSYSAETLERISFTHTHTHWKMH